MINDLVQASNEWIELAREIEENEGVLTEDMEKRWDAVVAKMSGVSDQLADTLDYIDVAIATAKMKKDRYFSKQKSLENFKARLRDTAKNLMLNGIKFQTEDRSVKINSTSNWNVDDVDINDLDEKFVKTEKVVKKKELIQAIKSGEIMPPKGARTITKESLVVR